MVNISINWQSRHDFFKPSFLPKKQINEFDFTTPCTMTCFRSFFGSNWRYQKDISKLTDLYLLLVFQPITSQLWNFNWETALDLVCISVVRRCNGTKRCTRLKLLLWPLYEDNLPIINQITYIFCQIQQLSIILQSLPNPIRKTAACDMISLFCAIRRWSKQSMNM